MYCKKCGKEIPEGKELCAECEKQAALAASAEITPAVVTGTDKKGLSKKTIGIIIGVCVAAAVVIVALILVFAGKGGQGNEPSSIREYVSFYRDEDGSEKQVIVTEKVAVTKKGSDDKDNNDNKDNQNMGDNNAKPNTTKKAETVPAKNPNNIGNEVKEEVKVNNRVQNALTSFFNGKFYYDGIMYAEDGTATKLKMAVNGNDLEAIMYESSMNVNMGIMQIDGKTYIVNTDKKQYIEFTQELGEMFGINLSDLQLGDLSKLFASRKSEPDAQYSTTVNGKAATCYEYVSADKSTSTKFYFVGNDLVELDQSNADGTGETRTMINEFSYSIPSDMLTLNGLTQASSIMSIIQ